jgi:hypothetical protein
MQRKREATCTLVPVPAHAQRALTAPDPLGEPNAKGTKRNLLEYSKFAMLRLWDIISYHLWVSSTSRVSS